MSVKKYDKYTTGLKPASRLNKEIRIVDDDDKNLLCVVFLVQMKLSLRNNFNLEEEYRMIGDVRTAKKIRLKIK